GAVFGADGPAVSGATSYALSVVGGGGTDSGVVDTASGNHVFVFVEGGVVVGREGTNAGTAAGGPIVFTVSVDASGSVTLDQQRAIVHPTASNPDSNEAVAIGSNLITLTATATDKDADSASANLDLGPQLSFHDDGPTISLSGNTPSLTVDETFLAVDASASFAGAFTAAFGADGPAVSGATTYALSVVGGGGTDSGLVDTASGNHVFLFVEGGVVVGREGTNAGTAAGGPIVFTVSVDASGSVTLDQQRAIVHPTASNPDSNEAVAIGSNLITLT